MTLTDIKYKPFSLKLTKPFITNSQTITERKGFYLSVKDDMMNEGFGEVITLPGFSSENISDALVDLKKLSTIFRGMILSENFFELEYELRNLKLVPSVQFGLEQALMSILLSMNHNSILNTYELESKNEINVNAVVGFAQKNEVLSHAKKFLDSGYSTLKLKIGRDNFDEDFTIIENLRRKFGNEFNLRLDVNGRWSFENASSYIKMLEPFKVEYIEDACIDLNDLENISRASKIPIAVDQPITNFNKLEKIIEYETFDIVVLKPIVLGSIFRLIEMIGKAAEKKIKIIISSGFESAIGRCALILLASLTNHNYAHGLAASEYFEIDHQNNFYNIDNGKINFDLTNYPPQFSI